MKNRAITITFAIEEGNHAWAEQRDLIRVGMVEAENADGKLWRVVYLEKEHLSNFPKLAGMQAKTAHRLAKKIVKYITQVDRNCRKMADTERFRPGWWI